MACSMVEACPYLDDLLAAFRFWFDLRLVGFSLVSVNLNLLGVDSDLRLVVAFLP